MIILKAIKVFINCTNVEQSLFKQIMTEDRIFPSSSFLWRSLCVCKTVGFCDQTFSWSSSLGWTKELCSQQPFLVDDWSLVLRSAQLVSHVPGTVHQKEKLSLQNKSNWVLR